MTTAFTRHPSLQNRSYLPPDWPTYTNTGASGQRFAMWYPKGDAPAGGWPVMVWYNFANFGSSDDLYADNGSETIGQGTGNLWQFLQFGIALAVVQITGPDKNNPGGRGFWHPPGAGSERRYELDTYQSPLKDVVLAFQHIRWDAERLNINPNRMFVGGTSAGAHAAAYIGLAPNRANAFGIGGQHNVSTVPNGCWFIEGPFPLFNHYDGTATPVVPSTLFAQAFTGANAEVASANLSTVATSYKRTAEWPDWIGGAGPDYVPPIFAWTNTDSASDTWMLDPQQWEFQVADTTNLHNAWNQAVLKSWFGDKVFWGVKPENLDGVIDDHLDFLLAQPLSQAGAGTAGAYQMDEMIAKLVGLARAPSSSRLLRPWDETVRGHIRRRCPVETVGRIVCPPNPRRKKARILCADTDGVAVDMAWDEATFALAQNESVEIEGTGPIYAKASANTSECIVFEELEAA